MLSAQVLALSHAQCRELGCRRRYNHLPSCGKQGWWEEGRTVKDTRLLCSGHLADHGGLPGGDWLFSHTWFLLLRCWTLFTFGVLFSSCYLASTHLFQCFSLAPQSTCDSHSDISLFCLPDIPRRPANVLELCAKQERTGSEWTFAIEDWEVWDLFSKGFYKDFTAF